MITVHGLERPGALGQVSGLPREAKGNGKGILNYFLLLVLK